MKQFVYSVWYGKVPYNQKIFTKWTDASKFIKDQIDAGLIIHSVHKEWAESENDSDERGLVKAQDVIGDR